MTQDHDAGEQLALPLPPGSRRQQVTGAVRRVGSGVAAGLVAVLRWVLRLALPVLGGAAALQLFPYHATVQQIPFRVEGSVLRRPGLSADTTLGSWEFPDLSGLPVGVHISPEDVDVLQITRAAGGDMVGFVERLQADFAEQVPRIAAWLGGTFLLGVLGGLAVVAAIDMSLRYLRGRPRRPHELRRRAAQLGVAGLITALVAGYGVLTFNPDWVRSSRLTGTLAAAQLFPDQLSAYYSQSNKAFDVLGSVVGIQAELQDQIDAEQTPETALRIMTISDMHLEANYPLVARYAASYDVDLILNTGDEAEFGTAAELTPAYLDALRTLTADTPMIWISGNHDSPAVEAVMRTVPGVTVLGASTATGDGYDVTAGVVEAYGLTVAGIADPRVYGGPGAYGSDDPEVVDQLQRAAVDQALAAARETADGSSDATGARAAGADDGGVGAGAAAGGDAAAAPAPVPAPTTGGAAAATTTASGDDGYPRLDVFAAHEPVAAEYLREVLPGQIRQTNAGHTHAQNPSQEIQDGAELDLVEGSTGGGGLDNIVRGTERPPVEFSIESVGADCQFTRIVRFQIRSADTATSVATSPADIAQAYGDDVTASTVYFRPQDVGPDRLCSLELGIGPAEPLQLD